MLEEETQRMKLFVGLGLILLGAVIGFLLGAVWDAAYGPPWAL